jgi:Domain of unknown function (DUF4157)
VRTQVDGTWLDVRELEACRGLRHLPASAVAIGSTVYVRRRHLLGPEGEDLLRHEAQHVRDWQRFGPLLWLSYLLLLPAGPSLRAFWEWRAYSVSLRAAHERQGRVDEATREFVVRQFTCAAPYLWMWPFPRQVRRWVDEACRRLER